MVAPACTNRLFAGVGPGRPAPLMPPKEPAAELIPLILVAPVFGNGPGIPAPAG